MTVTSTGEVVTIAPLGVDELRAKQDEVRTADMYQPGGPGPCNLPPNPNNTWCNQSTYDLAEATGFHADTMYGGEHKWNVDPWEACGNLWDSKIVGDLSEVSAIKAQRLADVGYTVIVAYDSPTGIPHLSTVRPAEKFDPSEGPLLSNVGQSNGIKTVLQVFGETVFLGKEIRYYYDPKQKF